MRCFNETAGGARPQDIEPAGNRTPDTLAVPEKFYVIGYALSLIFMPDAVFNV